MSVFQHGLFLNRPVVILPKLAVQDCLAAEILGDLSQVLRINLNKIHDQFHVVWGLFLTHCKF